MVDLVDGVDSRHVQPVDGLALGQELAAVDVLGHHQAGEFRERQLVVHRGAPQLAQGLLGRQVVQVQRRLGVADGLVGMLQHRLQPPPLLPK